MSTENYSPTLLQFLKAPAKAVNQTIYTAAQQRQQQLTKPPGSLGQLETLAIRLASLQATHAPKIQKLAIRIFAADHGVVEEGVSAFPQSVTGEMIKNFASGGAAICVLANFLAADFGVINLGTVTPLPALEHVTDRRIRAGTHNFTQAPAMSEAELEQALLAGRQTVLAAKESQVDLYIGGEMGIGNTTSASALACALMQQNPDALVGRGTGVDDAGIQRKISAVTRALALHQDALSSPLACLQTLGGLEIAALVGAIVACAQEGIPVMIDGFIASAAALVALAINPAIKPWLIFSHCSAEAGHAAMLEYLQAEPLLRLNMRLGEASGAAIAVPLLQMACELHSNMATFEQAGVSH